MSVETALKQAGSTGIAGYSVLCMHLAQESGNQGVVGRNLSGVCNKAIAARNAAGEQVFLRTRYGLVEPNARSKGVAALCVNARCGARSARQQVVIGRSK